MKIGVIRRKPVLTHASIVCEGMLASVNSVNVRELAMLMLISVAGCFGSGSLFCC